MIGVIPLRSSRLAGNGTLNTTVPSSVSGRLGGDAGDVGAVERDRRIGRISPRRDRRDGRGAAAARLAMVTSLLLALQNADGDVGARAGVTMDGTAFCVFDLERRFVEVPRNGPLQLPE